MRCTISLMISVPYYYIRYHIFAFTLTFIFIFISVLLHFFISLFFPCHCRYLGIRMVDLTPARPTATFEPTVEVQYADGDVSWFKRIVEKELWLYRCVGGEHELSIFFTIYFTFFSHIFFNYFSMINFLL